MTSLSKIVRGLGVLGLLTVTSLVAGDVVAQERSLDAIDLQAGDGSAELVLTLSDEAQGSAVSFFKLPDPRQIVIDVADTGVGAELSQMQGSGDLVERIEVEPFSDPDSTMSRIRVYLRQDVDADVQTQGTTIRVVLTGVGGSPMAASDDPLHSTTASTADEFDTVGVGSNAGSPELLSGPNQLPTGASVSSLDFQSLDTVSRIVIGTNEAVQFTASQPQANLIVVDFQGAFLPQSLTRVLDTSEFISPVRLVRAYRTSSGARVAISLRTSTDYTVRQVDDRLIHIDVDVPSRMQQDRQISGQGFSAVSPTGGGDVGISNAYQREQFISSQGRTVDPTAVFGTGAGASDPSSLLGFASGFLYDSMDATSLPYSGQRISMDFVNADIHSIFRLISNVARLNIIASESVSGSVTVKLDDVPWDQALAAILQAKGLGSQRFGNIIRIAPIESIKSEQQSALAAKQAQEQLEDLDLLILPLNYAQAAEIQPQVSPLLGNRGSLQVDARGNQLIIKETAARLAQIRELVRHLDKQTPQVTIEARVVEASSGFTRSMGIQWGGTVDASNITGNPTGWFFPNEIGIMGGRDGTGNSTFFDREAEEAIFVDLGSQAGDVGSMALNLGSIDGLINLDVRLAALEADGYGKVVSSPKITTLDNSPATISQGTQIPFLSTSSTGTSVQFVNATLDLTVTPHITNDDRILMDLQVSNNRADFGLLVNGQPAIQVKQAQTNLLVADGDTTVLGGVYAMDEAESQQRIPGLHKIPLLGYLFKNYSYVVNRNELLVFITPHIVTRSLADEG